MRFHSLEVQAIGPYADKQTLNFDDVSGAQDGVFLIEGPTGSGKSSILDAITFALYGNTDEDRGGLRSTAASPEDESFVELVFSVAGKKYKVRRTPSYQRPKKRGDGMTTANPTVQLFRWGQGTWSAVSSQIQEVGAEVSEIIGLTREQFSQVAVLPQGRFARFLQAKEDDRKKVLETLFDVQIYADVEARLIKARTEAARTEDLARVRLEKRLGEALQRAHEVGWQPALEDDSAAFSLDDHVAALGARTSADIIRELDEVGTWLGDHLRERDRHLTELSATLLEAQKREREAAAEAERAEQAAAAHRAFADHLATKPEQDAREQRLQAAIRAESVVPFLAAMREADDEASAAHRALAEGPEVPQAGLDASAETLRTLVVTLKQEVATLEPLRGQDSAASVAEAELADLRTRRAEADERLREATEALARLNQALEKAQRAVEREPELSARLAELDVQMAAASELILARAELEACETATTLAEGHERDASAALFAATDQFEREAPGRLAQTLIDGQPCLVCGSTEHPRPATVIDADLTTLPIAETREAYAAAQERAQAARKAQVEAAERVRDLQTRSGDRPADGLDADRRTVAAELEASKSERSGVSAEEHLAALREQEQHLVEQREEQQKLGARLEEQIRQAEKEADEQAGKVATARGEYESVAARIDALEAAADAAGQRAALTDVAQQKQAAAAKARADVDARALEAGFASWQAASDAALGDDQRAELERLSREWREQRKVLLSKLDDGEPVDPAVADERWVAARETAHEQATASRVINEKVDAVSAQVAGERQAIASYADRKKEAVQASEQFAQTQEQLAVVKRLGDLASGGSGLRRMTLTAFVLRQWFADVVAAANLRLKEISRGRYLLEITTERDDTQRSTDRTGLNLALRDLWTNAARSTSSLSGGERFYTSLSLALGLADVVAGQSGARMLEMLFIDEGFDSLDSKTLDDVMDVIERLRENGRTVGIISHVDSLKERIPSRIQVRPNNDGTSAITLSEAPLG